MKRLEQRAQAIGCTIEKLHDDKEQAKLGVAPMYALHLPKPHGGLNSMLSYTIDELKQDITEIEGESP